MQHMNSPLESAKAAFLPSNLPKTEPVSPNKSSLKSTTAKSSTPATPDSASFAPKGTTKTVWEDALKSQDSVTTTIHKMDSVPLASSVFNLTAADVLITDVQVMVLTISVLLVAQDTNLAQSTVSANTLTPTAPLSSTEDATIASLAFIPTPKANAGNLSPTVSTATSFNKTNASNALTVSSFNPTVNAKPNKSQ